jgi:hypothetical protein
MKLLPHLKLLSEEKGPCRKTTGLPGLACPNPMLKTKEIIDGGRGGYGAGGQCGPGKHQSVLQRAGFTVR